MAQLAAKIDADGRQLGRTNPFVDLLIGATALHFGYAAVGTRNLRHFHMLPRLDVAGSTPLSRPNILFKTCPFRASFVPENCLCSKKTPSEPLHAGLRPILQVPFHLL